MAGFLAKPWAKIYIFFAKTYWLSLLQRLYKVVQSSVTYQFYALVTV